MKKTRTYKSMIHVLLLCSIATLLINCNSSAYSNTSLNEKASQWYNKKEWLNGLQLTPHESINQEEF